MRRTAGLLIILAATSAGRAWADDRAEARAVIDRAIRATGGEEKLAKFKAQTWREKGKFYGLGDGLPYTGKSAVQFPDKFRMEIEGVFTIVLNGDKGWVQSQGETKEMTKEQLASQKEGLYGGWVSTLIPLKDRAFTLSPLAEVRVNNRPAVGVKVSRKGHKDVSLYFDKETGLLVKSEQRVHSAEQDKEVLQESIYSDYKEVEGVKVPMKGTIKRDGKPYVEAENQDVKPAGKLDESVFAKP
jgi:hypothetical protein